MEGHYHRRKKVRFFKTCLFETYCNLQMRKQKTLFFLVLPEPFFVEKTILEQVLDQTPLHKI